MRTVREVIGMDFRFAKEEEAFRLEVREFLKGAVTEEVLEEAEDRKSVV